MPFSLDAQLLADAAAVLAGKTGIKWVIGGACAGKSTICRTLAATHRLPVYDMDEHIYGSYMSSYSAARHPASSAWFSAPDPLAWVLGLSWCEFEALNRTATAEYLDLLAADPTLQQPGLVLIDGGITHPSLLAQAIPARQTVCLSTSDADRTQTWETSPARSSMKAEIWALPDPAAMWRKFLYFDYMINRTLEEESRAAGIPVLLRDDNTTIDQLAAAVSACLGL